MSYKIKTLIVFDTNSLRSTEGGEVAYSFFAFGRPFQVIEKFISEKYLTEDIHIAIPSWAIEELKDQKHRQYKDDIIEFEKLAKRLSGLPHIGEIILPEIEFDCATYVGEKAREYLATKSIKLLEIKEEVANTILQSMMTRVMKDERDKAPFVHVKKGSKMYKDAGFKDNLIWESLLHFEDVINYDKIIFVTNDSDYNEVCASEFRLKWNKHISVFGSEALIIADIQRDYGNYIDERAIHDFAQTEYFKDYLYDELKVKTTIVIDDQEYAIENFAITEVCKSVERLLPNVHEVENIIVSTEIKISYSIDGEKKVQIAEGHTLLEDDETKDIISTDFNLEIK